MSVIGRETRPHPSRDQSGMTVVEVVIAVFILVIGMIAAFSALDASSRNAFRTEQSQDLVNVAQRELEAIRNLDYNQAALTASPANSADVNDPRHRVSGGTFALNRDGTDTAQMTVNGVAGVAGGTIDPGPTPFISGDISGEVFRFVVWRDDPSVAGVGNDLKRVVVAVMPTDTALAGDRTYYEVQSDVADPNGGVLGTGPPADPGQEVDAQHFWLSDTQHTTSAACNRPRQPITASSATNDTRGSCGAANAPDAMYRNPAPRDPNHPTEYDYSTGVTAQGTGAEGTGLQLNKQPLSTCSFNPAGGATQIHRWITPPLNLTVSDQVDLVLYARKPDGGQGSICVFVYNASGLGLMVPLSATISGLPGGSCVPRPIVLPNHFVCSSNSWQSGSNWRKYTVSLRYLANIGLISRLGVAIGVAGGGTPSNQFQFLYDHPTGPSRLDVFPVL